MPTEIRWNGVVPKEFASKSGIEYKSGEFTYLVPGDEVTFLDPRGRKVTVKCGEGEGLGNWASVDVADSWSVMVHDASSPPCVIIRGTEIMVVRTRCGTWYG